MWFVSRSGGDVHLAHASRGRPGNISLFRRSGLSEETRILDSSSKKDA